MEENDPLRALRRHRAIGPATKLAFEWLWRAAGEKPGRVEVSLLQWGLELGRSERSVRGWIRDLVAWDLIQVTGRGDDDEWHVDVYHPAPPSDRRKPAS
ncbi:MAG: hypothetical protein JW809_14775 [Pirellulales bacterium]|nr:hypothetical protein [Pirellulales bacterium]